MFLNAQRSDGTNSVPHSIRRGSLVVMVALAFLTAERAAALSCYCDYEFCPTLDVEQCAYGVVKDACACCDECARGPGEACGGIWGEEGHCGDGYECIVEVPFGTSYTKYYQTPGACETNKTEDDDHATTELPTTAASTATSPQTTEQPAGDQDDCRDKCTVEFCQDGKNRYCSATENAFQAQEERGICQHTTCRACRLFVGPTCPTCPEPVNKSCLRKYFKCISAHYQEDNIMLELHDPLAQNATGLIICHVPETNTEEISESME